MPDSHLSDEQLARFRDGDLPPAGVMHLRDCAVCGARLSEQDAALGAYVEYRDSVRAPSLPPPPDAWRSLDELIADRPANRRTMPLRWLWAPALALSCALAWMLIVAPQLPLQTSARASELLERSARSHLPAGRQIQLRAHGRSLIRPAVLHPGASAAGDPDLSHLAALFQAARYDWVEPLSSGSLRDWRATLVYKVDSVTVIHTAGAKESYRVRTETSAGPLRSASLTLRGGDLRPTAGDFEFQGEGPVSMEEAAPEPEPQPVSRANAARELSTETPAGREDTLRVLAALDAIDAGVGEPVDVSLEADGRHVLVRASGLTDERRHQIAEALHSLPHVALDLESTVPIPATPPQVPSETYGSSIPAPMRQRFEERLGGALKVQEATDQALDASSSMLARAHALEILANDFPRETEMRLPASDRQLLLHLRQRHLEELQRLSARIRTALGQLLADSAPNFQNADDPADTWQDSVPALAAAARELDRLLNRLLAGSYTQTAGEQMLRELGPSLRNVERRTSALETHP